MTAIVTVRAAHRPAEVFRFPMDHGEPADGAEWQLVDTVQPGESRDFYAHNGKAIMVQTVPADPPA